MSLKQVESNESKTPNRFLRAVDITPRDDGFHGNINFLDIEWWYFDAVFDNGYSVHVGLRTYHIKNSGVVQSRINIYKEGKAEVKAVKTNLFSDFYVSSEQPLLHINGKPVVEFDMERYRKMGEWRYYVSLGIKHHEVDLTFVGNTRGWKIVTSDTSWVVPLPKAKVNGWIKIHGRKIPVEGTGYHDHNWGYSLTTSLNNLGWFWGRVTGDSLSITWVKTMQTIEKGDLLAVLNQEGKNTERGFYSVPPGNILFTPGNFVYNHRRWIPTEFNLQVKDAFAEDNTRVGADLRMKTFDIHGSRIFTIHYWRYHVKVTGEISIGSTVERLHEKPQIVEFLSFKAQDRKIMEKIQGRL